MRPDYHLRAFKRGEIHLRNNISFIHLRILFISLSLPSFVSVSSWVQFSIALSNFIGSFLVCNVHTSLLQQNQAKPYENKNVTMSVHV